MVKITVDSTVAYGGYWSLSASWTVQAPANNTDYEIDGDDIDLISSFGRSIIVDGMTFYCSTPAGGMVVIPWVRPSQSGAVSEHRFGSHTSVGATVYGYAAPLGIMVYLQPGIAFIGVRIGTTLQFDTIRFTAWGHYVESPVPPAATPVAVNELNVWPWKRV